MTAVGKPLRRAHAAPNACSWDDYPHAEGVPTPKDVYTEASTTLSAADARAIMHDDGRRLLPRAT